MNLCKQNSKIEARPIYVLGRECRQLQLRCIEQEELYKSRQLRLLKYALLGKSQKSIVYGLDLTKYTKWRAFNGLGGREKS